MCFSRYNGQEGLAPATYLMKSNDPYARDLVEKSKQSGVQIIHNLADISSIMTTSSNRNSAAISPTVQRRSAVISSASSRNSNALCPENFRNSSEPAAFMKEAPQEHSTDNLGRELQTRLLGSELKLSPSINVAAKKHSLERGGKIKPPPRQKSFPVSLHHAEQILNYMEIANWSLSLLSCY